MVASAHIASMKQTTLMDYLVPHPSAENPLVVVRTHIILSLVCDVKNLLEYLQQQELWHFKCKMDWPLRETNLQTRAKMPGSKLVSLRRFHCISFDMHFEAIEVVLREFELLHFPFFFFFLLSMYTSMQKLNICMSYEATWRTIEKLSEDHDVHVQFWVEDLRENTLLTDLL